MKSVRKYFAAALAAGAFLAASAPAYADPAPGGVCSLAPRICEILCIKGGGPARCSQK